MRPRCRLTQGLTWAARERPITSHLISCGCGWQVGGRLPARSWAGELQADGDAILIRSWAAWKPGSRDQPATDPARLPTWTAPGTPGVGWGAVTHVPLALGKPWLQQKPGDVFQRWELGFPSGKRGWALLLLLASGALAKHQCFIQPPSSPPRCQLCSRHPPGLTSNVLRPRQGLCSSQHDEDLFSHLPPHQWLLPHSPFL